MGSRIIFEHTETTIHSYHYLYQDDKVEFSEIDEKSGAVSYYTLEKLDTFKTKLRLDYYIKRSLVSNIIFALGKKSALKLGLEKSLMNLTELVAEIGDAVRRKPMPVE